MEVNHESMKVIPGDQIIVLLVMLAKINLTL